MTMKLEDVEYFSAKKKLQPAVFDLAQKVFNESLGEVSNAAEIQRRLESHALKRL